MMNSIIDTITGSNTIFFSILGVLLLIIIVMIILIRKENQKKVEERNDEKVINEVNEALKVVESNDITDTVAIPTIKEEQAKEEEISDEEAPISLSELPESESSSMPEIVTEHVEQPSLIDQIHPPMSFEELIAGVGTVGAAEDFNLEAEIDSFKTREVTNNEEAIDPEIKEESIEPKVVPTYEEVIEKMHQGTKEEPLGPSLKETMEKLQAEKTTEEQSVELTPVTTTVEEVEEDEEKAPVIPIDFEEPAKPNKNIPFLSSIKPAGTYEEVPEYKSEVQYTTTIPIVNIEEEKEEKVEIPLVPEEPKVDDAVEPTQEKEKIGPSLKETMELMKARKEEKQEEEEAVIEVGEPVIDEEETIEVGEPVIDEEETIEVGEPVIDEEETIEVGEPVIDEEETIEVGEPVIEMSPMPEPKEKVKVVEEEDYIPEIEHEEIKPIIVPEDDEDEEEGTSPIKTIDEETETHFNPIEAEDETIIVGTPIVFSSVPKEKLGPSLKETMDKLKSEAAELEPAPIYNEPIDEEEGYNYSDDTEEEVEGIPLSELSGEPVRDDNLEELKVKLQIHEQEQPKIAHMTPYEVEQEEKAIISYDELVKQNDNVSIEYQDQDEINPEVDIKQVDLEKTGKIELDPIKKALNSKVENTPYEHEEEFLDALKGLLD